MIPLRDQEVLRQRLKEDLTSRVRIDFFTQKPSSIFVPGREECVYCQDIQVLLEEIASLNDRVTLTVHEFGDAQALATTLGVEQVPAIVIRGQTNRPIRYYGLPAGTEFASFIEALVESATGKFDLLADSTRRLRKLKEEVRLRVLVTTTCPYCPAVVRTATKLALQSNRIKVDVVEIGEFPALIQRFKVRAVPTTVFNDKVIVPGAMDEAALLDMLFQVVEGKPLSGQTRVAPATALAPAQPQQQQQTSRPANTTASGLILPR
jgi:glutaredoxin-like protein